LPVALVETNAVAECFPLSSVKKAQAMTKIARGVTDSRASEIEDPVKPLAGDEEIRWCEDRNSGGNGSG